MATEKHKGRDIPDPASSYGREKPEHESGQGRLENNKATPSQAPDRMDHAVHHKQDPRQINADDEAQSGGLLGRMPSGGPRSVGAESSQPDHSMKEEEPDGWDQAPTDIHDPRQKRHPRTEGRGGTP